MAEYSPTDLEWVLKKSGYWKYYPEKLTRQDFFRVVDPAEFKKDSNGSYDLGQICDIFLYNIRFCNEDARDLPTGKPRRLAAYSAKGPRSPMRPNSADSMHPLDVITAVFLCCNPIARQDLVRLLWECKFAIPLLIRPGQLELLTLYTWPLQTIRYKPFAKESCHNTITECKLSVFSFARIGEINVSKSSTVNTVVCQSSTEYPVFFHRDCKSSTKRRSDVVEGLIETTFASIEDSDVMFLNMRGDSNCHNTELDVLVQISDVLVIFLKKDRLHHVKSMHSRIEKNQRSLKTLFLVTNANADDVEDCAKITEYLPADESITYDIIPILSMPKPDLMEEITKFFNSVHKASRTINSITKYLTGVQIDESSDDYQTASKHANCILEFADTQQTESFLPLQGEAFRQLSVSGKAIHREHDEGEVNRHKDIIKQCRVKQLSMLENEHLAVHAFLKLFAEVELNDTARQLFLKQVALGLERKYRRATHQFQEEHKGMLYAKTNRKLEEKDSTHEYTSRLRQLERKMSRTAATLSSFVKEIGQMFEALSETNASPQEFIHLPNVAVKILMDGYPVEIMDGETTTVPIKWVSAVLGELNRHLQVKDSKKTVKVKVVSILGIQSSGKSTLLNTMFGSTFSVGSGRCTRGVYMYMVKVAPDTSLAEEVDYILVVDGEGISALEYEEDLSKERELATFVLGIADVTILNIMSENTIYLRDILPISVHAFLRMDLVGIRPKCVIAHQNVDPMSRCLLVTHWHDLEKALDEYTKAACHLEGVELLKCFRDIVKLDITRDIHCFPSYRRQYSNTDVVSSGYSSAAIRLASSVNSEQSSVRSIGDFQQFITLLWSALKREHFVYEFKNTVQAEARLIADDNWCKVAWKMRQQVRKAATGAHIEIQNSCTLEQCDASYTRSCTDLDNTIKRYSDELKEELKTLFKSTRGIFKEPLKQFKEGAIIKFDDLCRSLTDAIKSELDALHDHTCKAIKLKIEDARSIQEVTSFIENERQHAKERTEESDECDIIFKKWIQTTANDSRPFRQTRDHMEMAAKRRLREAFPSEVKYITEQLRQLSDNHLFTMTICDKYISNLSRQTVDIRQHKKMAQQLIQKTKDFVVEYFRDRKQSAASFDVEVFTDLISQTKVCFEQSGVIIRKVFQIDLAIGTVAYALQEFEHECAETTSIAFTDLTSNRFRDLYLGIVANEKKKLEQCVENIRDGMVEKVLKQVCDELAEDLKQYKTDGVTVFQSKRTVMLLIFRELILETNKGLNSTSTYLRYQTGWTRSWICRTFENYCVDDQASNVSKIQRLLATLLSPVRESVRRVLEDLDNEVYDRQDWRCVLQEKLSEQIGVCLTDVSMSSSEEALIKSRLLEEFEAATDECVKDVYQTFIEESYYDQIKVSVTDAVFESIIGCTEMCPYCGEVCIYGQPNHEGKHKTLVHRPVAYIHDPKETQLTDCERHISEQKRDWEAGNSVDIESTIQFLCTELLRALPHQDQGSREDFRIPEEWTVLTAECELQKLATELDKHKDG